MGIYQPFPQAWLTWSPTWTNFTPGNGTLNYASYQQFGKTVFFKLKFTWGSTSSASGKITFTSPVTMVTLSAGDVIDSTGILTDSSVPEYKTAILKYESTTTISINAMTADTTYTGVSATGTSSTVPYTWATGDIMNITGTCEAA